MTQETAIFTSEDEKRLHELYSTLSFSGALLPGKFNANKLNPFQLLNETDVRTLEGLWKINQDYLDTLAKVPRRGQTTNQAGKTKALKVWVEFLDLLILFKDDKAQKARRVDAAAIQRSELKRLKEEALTPKERIDTLEKALEGAPVKEEDIFSLV